MPAAGAFHTVLLRSDGRVTAFGDGRAGQCDLPEPGEGAMYAQVAAGGDHTAMLRSDGRVVLCGDNARGCGGWAGGSSRHGPTPSTGSGYAEAGNGKREGGSPKVTGKFKFPPAIPASFEVA